MLKTAILVDGGFYRRRAYTLWGNKTAEKRAGELELYCKLHIRDKHEERMLYRVFYYDCPPVDKKIYHPFLKQQIDLGKSELFAWTDIFLKELKQKRKFAIRLGELADSQAFYTISPKLIKPLCSGKIKFEDLGKDDFVMDIKQKGVDMRIGLDISSMAYKKQVDQIILISGDSDFVPALKLARREGIDVILDPMQAPVKDNLLEHIDGIRTQNIYNNKKAGEDE